MSGHSKWSTIKRKKGANDAQRAKEFTKVARIITVAAQNGGDPNENPALALAIDKARSINMPKDNIERAITKAQGGSKGEGRLEAISYEGYAPHNVAIIIDCTTDNRNRTVGEVRSVIEKNGGTMAEGGAVSWQFSTIGRVLLEFETDEEKKERQSEKWNKDTATNPKLQKENAEEFELELYDIEGVQEIEVEEYGVAIYTEPTKLASVMKTIEEKGVKVTESEFIKISSNKIELENDDQIERVESFIEKIEELDDVSKVWTNLRD